MFSTVNANESHFFIMYFKSLIVDLVLVKRNIWQDLEAELAFLNSFLPCFF